LNIRSCEAKDVQQIADIYNYYIENTVITFEEMPLSASDMGRRIASYTERYPWYVCEVDGYIAGYAYATKWKERTAYKNTLEITVYIKHSLTGSGYGKALFSALIESLNQTDCHVMLGCIALPNAASVGLHEHFGFKKVAHFPEVGRKFDRWLDVGYWQKIIPA
jgi:L-amino acid N-acyltransferase YncA